MPSSGVSIVGTLDELQAYLFILFIWFNFWLCWVPVAVCGLSLLPHFEGASHAVVSLAAGVGSSCVGFGSYHAGLSSPAFDGREAQITAAWRGLPGPGRYVAYARQAGVPSLYHQEIPTMSFRKTTLAFFCLRPDVG